MMMDHRYLVARVRDMRKQGFSAHWAFFCATYSDNTRDPMKYSPEFLVSFIRYASRCDAQLLTQREGRKLRTQPLPIEVLRQISDADMEHICEIKTLQRIGFRDAWISYCHLFGAGVRDPTKQSLEFCTRFILACQAGDIHHMLDQECKAQNYGVDDRDSAIHEI